MESSPSLSRSVERGGKEEEGRKKERGKLAGELVRGRFDQVDSVRAIGLRTGDALP